MTLQTAHKNRVRVAHSESVVRGYVSLVAASAMGKYLRRVALEAREAAGRRPYHIASRPRGEGGGVHPSTVWRFEHEDGWPQNADVMIDLYAADLDIEPIEFWARALELWRAAESGLTPEEEVDQLVEEIQNERGPAAGGDRSGARRPRAARGGRAKPKK